MSLSQHAHCCRCSSSSLAPSETSWHEQILSSCLCLQYIQPYWSEYSGWLICRHGHNSRYVQHFAFFLLCWCVHTGSNTHPCTQVPISAHMCMHTQTHIHAQHKSFGKHTRSFKKTPKKRTYLQGYTQPKEHESAQIYTRKHTHTRTHAHTHTHARAHTHTHFCTCTQQYT